MAQAATPDMNQQSSIERRPSSPLSYHDTLVPYGYANTASHLDADSIPYTPPRSHPAHIYGYDDPEQYEVPYTEEYYDHSRSVQGESCRTPPQQIGEGSILTRSRARLDTPVTASSGSPNSTSASPRPKRNRKGKGCGAKFVLEIPLSIATKDFQEPVRDMLAWAKRSHEERRREVDTQHKGNIPRPLNSFMLYRRAFSERIKKWGEQGNNNQLISSVAGHSWGIETPEVKAFYAKASIIERDNHAAAFPEYKFAPNKAVKKRSRNDDEEESDPEWDGSSNYSGKRRRGRTATPSARSRSSTPAQAGYSSPLYHASSFQASNPHMIPPLPQYQQCGEPVQYEPHYAYMPSVYHEQVQDLHYAPTSMPVQYDYHTMELVGMPPASDGVIGSQSVPATEFIDPSLEGLDTSTSYQYGVYSEVDPHGEYEGEPDHANHPGMQTLAPAEPMWSPSGATGSAFDAELTHWHGQS